MGRFLLQVINLRLRFEFRTFRQILVDASFVDENTALQAAITGNVLAISLLFSFSGSASWIFTPFNGDAQWK